MRVLAGSKRCPSFPRPFFPGSLGRTCRPALAGLALGAGTAIAAIAQLTSPDPAFRINGHRSEIRSVQLLPPDGTLVLTSSSDSLVTWTSTRPVKTRRLVDSDRLIGFSLSSDGSQVVVATLSGARILDIRTGRTELEFDSEQLPNLLWPEWSPSGDLIATRTRTAINLWNPATGDLMRILDLEELGARGPVRFAWSPDGGRIAALGRVGALKVFTVADGTVEFQTQAHDRIAIHLAWSPDGALVATGGNDGLVKLWKASDWTLSQALLNEGNIFVGGPGSPVDSIAFSPDSRRIAVAVAGASLRVWSTDAGQELLHWSNSGERSYEPHRGQVTDLAFSPDGRRLASAGHDRTVKIWNVESGTQLAVHDRFLNSMAAVAWSPDGSRYAAASWDGTGIVWDGASRRLATFEGHLAGRVLSLSFAPGLARLATSGTDGTVRVWHAGNGYQLFELPGLDESTPPYASPARPAVQVAYSPASNRVAMVSGRQSGAALEVRVVAASVGPNRTAQYSVESAAWSPDGRRIAAASTYVEIVDLANPESHATVLETAAIADSPDFRHVAWSRDGERVLAASASTGMTAWDWKTGRVVAEVRPENGAVYVEESPDGSLLLTVSGAFRRPVAQVWDRDAQAEVAAIVKERARIAEARFLSNGTRVLTRHLRNPTPLVWDAGTGDELFALEGHSRSVLGIAVSRDGQRVATGSADGTVRLWDAGTGREVAVLEGHPAAVQGVEFSAAGDLVAAYGRGGATVWRLGPEPARPGSR